MKLNKESLRNLQYIGGIVLLAIIYHLGARLGLLMANVQPNTSPVWPPTGIAIAALLLFGKKYWPGITLGVIFGYLFNNNALNITLALAVGNTLEAIAAVFILQRLFDFHNSLDRIQDVLSFSLVTALATTISATIGMVSLLILGRLALAEGWTVWLTWWIGDFLAALVITPLLLIWFTSWPIRWKRKSLLEASIVLGLLFMVTYYVFADQTFGRVSHEAMVYVIFPFVLYAALKFTQLGAVSSVALVSTIAIYGTAVGHGPLVRSSINESLILLQTFLGVVTLTALTLGSATSQRKSAEEALHQRIDDLAKLNDSSQTFLGIIDIQTMYQTACRFLVEKFGAKAAWIELDDGSEESTFIAAHYGIPEATVKRLRASYDDQLTPVTKIDPDANDKIKEQLKNNLVFLPLKFSTKNIGKLAIVDQDPQPSSHDRSILLDSYANLVSVAIQNIWLLDQVSSGNERLHALSRRLMEVQEAERLNMSRELHDESGQVISAIMVQLGLLERDATKPEVIKENVHQLKDFASHLLSNLHDMAVRLRPASLDHLGLVTALQQYIADFSRQHNLNVQFETEGLTSKRFPLEVETAIFRIVQESLTNVLLHARATRVDVLINRRKNLLSVVIEDDGVGFIPENVSTPTHLGLFGMRERVEMLDGKLTIESRLGKGTTIQVEVPNVD